jgi:transposase
MANLLKMALVDTILSFHRLGWSNRRIARELGIDRDAVSRHIQQARAQAKAAKAPPGSEEAAAEAKAAKAPTGSGDAETEAKAAKAPPGSETMAEPALVPASRSFCAAWHAVILTKVEAGLTAQRIYQDLVSEHGFAGKYHSVRRYVRRLGVAQALPFRRMECAAGEEAQVDFGSGVPLTTATGRRRTYVFRIILSHSRKGYSEVVFRQTTDSFLTCLENAFVYFGGVPRTLVLDNLKAAVDIPDWFDPQLNPKLRAFADHYGVAVLPTKPRLPRHKGKIESGVGYVKKNALKGHVFTSLEEENHHLRHWEVTVADTRVHGTTRKQVGKVFAEVERAALRPLPLERFPSFHEGQRTVNRDGHIEVAHAYYSAPPEYLGRRVWVRWDERVVRLFNDRLEQIAFHLRAEPGRFSTDVQHIASQKISAVERGAAWMLDKTRRIGAHAAGWAQAVIATRGVEGVRVLQGLLSLAQKHKALDLDKACEIAASYASYHLRTIRALLKRQAPKQESFDFMQTHPLIRNLQEYAERVHASFQGEARS